MVDGKVEEELVSPFTHIPAEIPGVRMAAHVQPDTGAVEAPPVPTMSYRTLLNTRSEERRV